MNKSVADVVAPSPSALPAYSKQEYIGAVTLLHFSRDGSLIFVGVGATLYVYEAISGELVTSYQVFPRGILHGLDYVPCGPNTSGNASNYVVFFGQKRLQCVRNLPETTQDDAMTQLQRVGKAKVCSDWIFDVQILSADPRVAMAPTTDGPCFPIIAVGLAHNFIQLWDPANDQLLRSLYCTERCILYSLSFHGRREEDLLIAAGTVFQQVLLWSGAKSSEKNALAEPKQRLHGHDGVIFKLEWSSDATMLASVSDDRTVQLWSTTTDAAVDALASPWTSRFRAWGHTARLWDVRFCDAGIVTSSEDGMCKVWQQEDGSCLATMQGHMGKHVWRVAVHPTHRLLATGGGDGAVKLWNVDQQIASTISTAGANCESIYLIAPPATSSTSITRDSTTPKTKTTKKRKTSSASVSIRDVVVTRGSANPRGFVAVEDGRVFELALTETPMTSSLLFSVGDKIEIDGSSAAQLSSFTVDEDEQFFLLGHANGSVVVVEIATLHVVANWKAHASRVMKVSWHQSAHGTLFTCGADGGVREWQLPLPHKNDGGSHVALVGHYAGPTKCATASVAIIDVQQTRNVVCGDARGNIFGFARSLSRPSHEQKEDHQALDEQATLEPTFVLKSIHGRDMVATLLCGFHGTEQPRGGGLLYSGGHDGYICSFLIEPMAADSVVTLRFVGRENIKGITTIKSLGWHHTHNNQQLMVFGFHATFAVLYNLTAQYRVFNVECGGWRRPHGLLTSTGVASGAIPSHLFVFTPVTKGDELVLQVHSTMTVDNTVDNMVVGRASLHHQYHGRTTTCIRMLEKNRLVTAGEDNSLKLHKRGSPSTTAGGSTEDRWTCVSTGVAHTTTIRALHSFYVASRNAHIVLSGGGKQRLNGWQVKDDRDVLEFLCGQEMTDADQDHRILGLTSFALDTNAADRYRLIVACNSEGSLQFLLLDLGETTAILHELGQCSSSKKPILSCDGLQRNGQALLAVGSTDGMVNVWNVTDLVHQVAAACIDADGVLRAATTTATQKIQQLEPVYKYLAHDMGTNCLCISSPSSTDSFTIISGGDDQNLRLHELALGSLDVISDTLVRNASGSALKAVATSRDGQVVYCAGYDQRVSQWRRDPPPHHDSQQSQWTWRCAAFTECADIADLDVWETQNESLSSADGYDTVVVVGQGLQTVQFFQ